MNDQKDLTLKEIIENIIEYSTYLITRWSVIVFIALLCGIVFGAVTHTKPIKYSAKLSFMVNEDDTGSGLGNMPAILGQFGFVGGSSGKYNRSKILELSRSRKIVSLVLFEKVSINGEMDFLSNHIIDEYQLNNRWAKNHTYFDGFEFTHSNLDSFSRMENLALQKLHKRIVGDSKNKLAGLISSKFDEETGILSFEGVSINEMLSFYLTNLFYEKLSEYYVEETTQKQRATFNVFKSKVDSLESALNSTNFAILKFDDSFRNLSLNQHQAEKYRLQGEVAKLSTAYAEAYKNLQIAELALENRTPFITTIDKPIIPLKIVKQSSIKYAMIGFLIGLVSTITCLLIIRFLKDLNII